MSWVCPGCGRILADGEPHTVCRKGFATIEKSGAVSVDLGRLMRSAKGRQMLADVEAVRALHKGEKA